MLNHGLEWDKWVVSPIHTADADETKLFCRVGVGGVNTFATSWRRLPTDSVDNFETDQIDSIAFDYTNFVNIDNFLNNDVIMSSLLKKLSTSTKIHVVKTQKQTQTQTVWPVSKLSTESVGSCRELVANSCTHRRRRRDETRQFRLVGGVYWA